MNEKKRVVPTPEEMKREEKRLKKEEKRRKSGKKTKEIVFGPEGTAKQKKKADKVLRKIIMDNLKEIDLGNPEIKH